MTIHKFKLPSGITDWVFAPNKNDAIQFYEDLTECDMDDVDIDEIPVKLWKSLFVYDSDGKKESFEE